MGGHHHHHLPKGRMAIKVGPDVDHQQRFVVPVAYVNHPLFMELLKEAEEEYGFEQKGPISIPCHVEHFRHVQGMIERDNNSSNRKVHHHHHHGHGHHHHLGCFGRFVIA